MKPEPSTGNLQVQQTGSQSINSVDSESKMTFSASLSYSSIPDICFLFLNLVSFFFSFQKENFYVSIVFFFKKENVHRRGERTDMKAIIGEETEAKSAV